MNGRVLASIKHIERAAAKFAARLPKWVTFDTMQPAFPRVEVCLAPKGDVLSQFENVSALHVLAEKSANQTVRHTRGDVGLGQRARKISRQISAMAPADEIYCLLY